MHAHTPADDLFSTVSVAVRRMLGDGNPEVVVATDRFTAPDHRTRLEYWWDPKRQPLIVIGQNPSKATRHRGDPTVTRCARRAHRLDLGGLIMLNLFSKVATNPLDMWAIPTDENHQATNLATIEATIAGYPMALILFAPGGDRNPRHVAATRKVEDLVRNIGRQMSCLGTTADGSPRHPSRCGYDVGLERWDPQRQDQRKNILG